MRLESEHSTRSGKVALVMSDRKGKALFLGKRDGDHVVLPNGIRVRP